MYIFFVTLMSVQMETSIKCVVMMALPFIRNTLSVFTFVYWYNYRILS